MRAGWRRTLVAAVCAGTAVAAATASHAAAAPDAAKRVVVGSDGYLFIAQDWTVACQDRGKARTTADRVAALASALQASGRPATVLVAPDKSSIMTKQVPARVPDGACGKAERAALWTALGEHGGPSFLDVRPAVAELSGKQQTYWRKDTHWTPTAGTAYASELARRIDPLTQLRLTTKAATYTRTGDLASVLGRPAGETVRGLQTVNPLVTVRELAPTKVGLTNPVRHTRATAALGGRVIPGRTVIVGDSMDDVVVEQLAPLFADAVFVWVLEQDPVGPVMAQVRGGDRVVVEAVERLAQRSRVLKPDAVAAARALPKRPVPAGLSLR